MKTNLIQQNDCRFFSKAIFLLCFFVFTCSLTAGNGYADSTLCLELSGRVTRLKEAEHKHYKVELVYNGQTVDSMIVKDKKEFRFKLKKNTVYGIRITKPGFITRYISIDTSIPGYANRIFRFEFDTELIDTEQLQRLNKDALDFPIAIISFNKDLKGFYYDEEYTSNIKRSVYLGEEF
jgi:hypothetical protein